MMFLKRSKPDSLKGRPGFKKCAKLIAGGLLILSFVLMGTCLFFPSVDLFVFHIGYAIIWMSVPFWIGARFAFKGFLLSIFILLLFFLLADEMGISLFAVVEEEYPVRVPHISDEDDLLEDKKPEYVSAFTEKRKGLFDRTWYFNKSTAVLGIGLGDVTNAENQLAEKVYPTFRAAMEAAEAFECNFLPSIDLIDGFTKYFDDRFLAAIEEHVHTSSSIFPGGKQGFLSFLLEELLKGPEAPGKEEAAAYLMAAIKLGGGHPEVAKAYSDKAQSYVDAFLANARNSKPVGFYTESEVLQDVFYRDRFLQKPFGTKFSAHRTPESSVYCREGLFPVIRLAETLLKNPELMIAYGKFRELAERICNPEANLNLEDLFPYKNLFGDEERLYEALLVSDAWERARSRGNVNPNTIGVAFWPFSYSKETRLMARLYKTNELPKTEVMNDLICAIKAGNVDLEPQEDSGWYDYQLYSLETLLFPERAHETHKVLLHAKYKKRLRESFESMFVKRRETHVKQLFSCHKYYESRLEPLPDYPELSLEPCATHYLRTARAYRFLADHLTRLFSDEELANLGKGTVDRASIQELENVIRLFYGLHLVACDDLGIVPQYEPKEISTLPHLSDRKIDKEMMLQEFLIANSPGVNDTERMAWFSIWKEAKEWLLKLDTQKFLDKDVRLIVPVLSNSHGTKVRNWAILGIRLMKIHSYYARPPLAEKSGGDSDENCLSENMQVVLLEVFADPGIDWQPRDYVIPVHVFGEVTLGPNPLARTEFREICDVYKTKDEILKALIDPSSKKRASRLLVGLAVVVLVAMSFLVWRFAVKGRQANRER